MHGRIIHSAFSTKRNEGTAPGDSQRFACENEDQEIISIEDDVITESSLVSIEHVYPKMRGLTKNH